MKLNYKLKDDHELFNLYIANKKGEPKLDYPPFDYE